MNLPIPATPEEYKHLVANMAGLLDSQMTQREQMLAEQWPEAILHVTPAMICLVNTIGFLRGQHNIFLDIRPHTDNQQELYSYEDFFEKRLNAIIQTILKSDHTDAYRRTISQYLVDWRTMVRE